MRAYYLVFDRVNSRIGFSSNKIGALKKWNHPKLPDHGFFEIILTVSVVLLILGLIISFFACSRKKSSNDEALEREFENEIRRIDPKSSKEYSLLVNE